MQLPALLINAPSVSVALTFRQGYARAARYGLKREFAHAYRWIKPWYAFWVSEADAVQMALSEWDLNE